MSSQIKKRCLSNKRMKVFDGRLASETSVVSGHVRLRSRWPPDGDGQLQEGQRLRGWGLPVSCCWQEAKHGAIPSCRRGHTHGPSHGLRWSPSSWSASNLLGDLQKPPGLCLLIARGLGLIGAVRTLLLPITLPALWDAVAIATANAKFILDVC